MRPGIRSKLFILSLALIVASLFGAGIYLYSALTRSMTSRIHEELLVRLALVRHGVSTTSIPSDDLKAWDRLADEMGGIAEARITIIRGDGVVLGDSKVELTRVPTLDNHLARPEVASALEAGFGEKSRYSGTLQSLMLYAAESFPLADGTMGVVRAALPLVEIEYASDLILQILLVSLLIGLVLAVMFSGLTSVLASRRIRLLTAAARAMTRGDLSPKLPLDGSDEPAELARTLDALAGSLSESMAALRSERDLLGGILNNMQEGVLLLDPQGRLTLANPAFREMLLVRTDLIGRHILEVLRHAELKELLDRAIDASGPVSGEIQVSGLKPRRLLVHASSAVPGSDLLVVLVDVTDLRKLEVIRRDFAANASHELRTPVTSARSALETLRLALERDPDAVGDFLEIIERNILRLHQLIEDLLDLSRLESGELRLEPKVLELSELVQSELPPLLERAEHQGIRLTTHVPRELPQARVDPRCFRQILTNLVDNALKYCPRGASVAINAREQDGFLRVSVEDSGPGIEARHLVRIFERFYRVDPGRSRDLGGTGLGLSIVKHLVDAGGGTVWAESTLGQGSSFIFTIPLN